MSVAENSLQEMINSSDISVEEKIISDTLNQEECHRNIFVKKEIVCDISEKEESSSDRLVKVEHCSDNEDYNKFKCKSCINDCQTIFSLRKHGSAKHMLEIGDKPDICIHRQSEKYKNLLKTLGSADVPLKDYLITTEIYIKEELSDYDIKCEEPDQELGSMSMDVDPESPSLRVPDPESSSDLPKELSFPWAVRQQDRIYQVQTPGKVGTVGCFVFTAQEHMNGGTEAQCREYKLLVPASSAHCPMSNGTLKDSIVTAGKSVHVLNKPNIRKYTLVFGLSSRAEAECEVVTSLEQFQVGVARGCSILVTQQQITTFCSQFQGALLPNFYFPHMDLSSIRVKLPEGEYNKIAITTQIERLGYEGIAIEPKDPKRLRIVDDMVLQIRQVNQGNHAWLQGHLAGEHIARLRDMVVLVEETVYQLGSWLQGFLHSPNHQGVLLRVKNSLMKQMSEYSVMKKWPDVMYLVMIQFGGILMKVDTRERTLGLISVVTRPLTLLVTPLQLQSQGLIRVQPAISFKSKAVGTRTVKLSKPTVTATTYKRLTSSREAASTSPQNKESSSFSGSTKLTGFNAYYTAQMKGLSPSTLLQSENKRLILERWKGLGMQARENYKLQAEEMNRQAERQERPQKIQTIRKVKVTEEEKRREVYRIRDAQNVLLARTKNSASDKKVSLIDKSTNYAQRKIMVNRHILQQKIERINPMPVQTMVGKVGLQSDLKHSSNVSELKCEIKCEMTSEEETLHIIEPPDYPNVKKEETEEVFEADPLDIAERQTTDMTVGTRETYKAGTVICNLCDFETPNNFVLKDHFLKCHMTNQQI